ncbi:MAG: Asp-tRNA(Asn)/Glu-tRNA(Gln) amidotransferase subunit GatA [Planctomycetota bacterium]|nr:Asp-tRNA(Asn)/Glu-tRNA(Gln) amidotransferase subunit GatA [Planctomycetota bacterium]
MNARRIAAGVRDGSRSATAVVRETLDKINAAHDRLGAFLAVFEDHALERAADIDARQARSEPLGPLAGVPIAVKDNICYAHGTTTCASRMLERYHSPFTATALQRLEDAGAIVVGKTNLDEFGMGSSCEHSAFGPTRNPWDETRVPGGSSGGSAAAVAAGLVPIAMGSDTGGSIRQPAAFCGVVGLKPTYGRVSRYGLVAYASSLDQIGPIAGTIEDCALALSVMQGVDPHDATSADRPGDHLCAHAGSETTSADQQSGGSLAGLVLGVPTLSRGPHNDADAQAVFDSTVGTLERAGAEVREIRLPHADHAVAAYYVIATAEAGSNLARYDGVRYGFRAELPRDATLEAMYTRTRTEGFGREVQRRIMLGTHVLTSGYHDAYYLTALKARRRIAEDFAAAFSAGCDAVCTPTTPGPAFALGAKLSNPLSMYAEDVYTVGASLAGLPAVSVPAGVVESAGARLPIGLQLIGRAWGEARLIDAAQRVVNVLHPEGFELPPRAL